MASEEEIKRHERQAKIKAQLERRLLQQQEEQELREHEKVFNERYKDDPRTMAEIGLELYMKVLKKADALAHD